MFRAGLLSFTGGLAILVVMLVTANLLKGIGISSGEALYLSVLGSTVVGYSMTEWRLRRKG